MVNIGEKIRILRKNKRISQAQLAEALSVSAQSVSKWETGLSAPDITLLPIVARYFGITMDELFGYRLDALNYKERFIRFMADNGVLQFGRFTLTSGRVSPYYIDTSRYRTASQLARLGEFYAECIRENNIEGELLAGSAQKDVPGVVAAGMTLYRKYGVDVGHCAAADTGEDLCGKSVILLKAVVATGDTVKKNLEQLRRQGAGKVNVVTAVDRMEKSSASAQMAVRELEKSCGVPVCAVVTLQDIVRAAENGVIGGAEHLGALRAYQNEYGGLE